MKAIKQAQTRNILDSYNKEDISYSRMNEMFNKLADDWAIGFGEYLDSLTESQMRSFTIKKLLEIYKTESL